jgi:phage baseplate assembly protein W
MATVIVQNRKFSDLDLKFLKNPLTGDVNILRDDAAVKRSLMNLVFTRFFEKPFNPTFGSSTDYLLFEQMDMITAREFHAAVRDLISAYEPRVVQNSIITRFYERDYKVEMTVTFRIVGSPQPVTISVFLERTR